MDEMKPELKTQPHPPWICRKNSRKAVFPWLSSGLFFGSWVYNFYWEPSY